MSRKAPLTDMLLRNARPKDKAYKLFDGGGLFLQIQPNGSKWWRYTYRFHGRQKLLALGAYPETSLAEAREKHAVAHKQVANGIDPSETKKEAKRTAMLNAENDFESVAREWHEKKCNTLQPRYAGFILRRLEADIFPKLGSRPIKDITPPELLGVIRLIEKRGAISLLSFALSVPPLIPSKQVFSKRISMLVSATLSIPAMRRKSEKRCLS